MDEVLAGEVANAGAVRRRGDVVVRPSTAHSPTIHTFLRALRTTWFTGAPEPLALKGAEEELRFVEGDVALPPYPAWVQSDDALASVARLLRRFHDASVLVSAPPHSPEMGEVLAQHRPEGDTQFRLGAVGRVVHQPDQLGVLPERPEPGGRDEPGERMDR